jgi:hypothetical protein
MEFVVTHSVTNKRRKILQLLYNFLPEFRFSNTNEKEPFLNKRLLHVSFASFHKNCEPVSNFKYFYDVFGNTINCLMSYRVQFPLT